MMRGVGALRKSIHQSWLAKGLGLGLLCWGFKGVQEEIPWEEASILQIGSVVFPPGQWTSHNSILVTDYLTKMGIKIVPHTPYSPDFAPCDFWLFPKLRGCRNETIEEMSEAVTKVIDTLTQEDFHGTFQKLLDRYNKCNSAGGVSCVYYQEKYPCEKKILETYHMHLVCLKNTIHSILTWMKTLLKNKKLPCLSRKGRAILECK